MKITVLGSGTSTGVPLLACPCLACISEDTRDKRLRSSCWISTSEFEFLIDMSPDLRAQAFANGMRRVDAVLMTHLHSDHTHGIDDMRHFNLLKADPIPIHVHATQVAELESRFTYIFKPNKIYPSMVPKLFTVPFTDDFYFKNQFLQVIRCEHGLAGFTYNFRIGDMAWLTDVNTIPPESKLKLKNLKALFIDAVRLAPHPTHFCLQETLSVIAELAPEQAFLIHLSHDYLHAKIEPTLPQNVKLAYDGLVVKI